jgi:hypothetical protein
VSGATLGVIQASVVEAEGAIYRVMHIFGIRVFLPIIFPPADGAESHGVRSFQCSMAATWAAEKRICDPHSLPTNGDRSVIKPRSRVLSAKDCTQEWTWIQTAGFTRGRRALEVKDETGGKARVGTVGR